MKRSRARPLGTVFGSGFAWCVASWRISACFQVLSEVPLPLIVAGRPLITDVGVLQAEAEPWVWAGPVRAQSWHPQGPSSGAFPGTLRVGSGSPSREWLKLLILGAREWRRAGRLKTTKPSFLGMPFGGTGSGASPKGRGGHSGAGPCLQRSLGGRRFSQVINPAKEAGCRKAARWRGRRKKMNQRDVPSVLWYPSCRQTLRLASLQSSALSVRRQGNAIVYFFSFFFFYSEEMRIFAVQGTFV